MRRRRDGLAAKAVTILLVSIVALGLTGMGYGIWSDTLNISGIVNTGVMDTRMLWTGSSSVPPSGGSIYGLPSGMTLDVHAINLEEEVDYYCYFEIDNNTGIGTLPVKIQSVTITPAVADWQTTYGINGSVTFDGGTKTPAQELGDVIEVGQPKPGTGHVSLDGAPEPATFDVSIVVEVVLWNQ